MPRARDGERVNAVVPPETSDLRTGLASARGETNRHRIPDPRRRQSATAAYRQGYHDPRRMDLIERQRPELSYPPPITPYTKRRARQPQPAATLTTPTVHLRRHNQQPSLAPVARHEYVHRFHLRLRKAGTSGVTAARRRPQRHGLARLTTTAATNRSSRNSIYSNIRLLHLD